MPREHIYDTHGAHWYAPSPYWDPHSPFMVRDPRYTGHSQMERMYPRMYPPMYQPSSHFVPMQSQQEHSPMHPLPQRPKVY